MNINADRLRVMKDYSIAIGSAVQYRIEDTEKNTVEYTLFKVGEENNSYCLYISNEVVQLSSTLIPDKIRFRENRTYTKCNRLYVAGGEQVTQIYGLNDLLSILGVKPEIVDFTYFKPKNIYNLMDAFNSCNIKIGFVLIS